MLVIAVGCLVAGIVVALAVLWWGRGEDRRTRDRPPEGVDPGLALLLRTGLAGRYERLAPVVVLTEMARRGAVRAVARDDGGWWLERVPSTGSTGYEKALVGALFGGGRNSVALDVRTLVGAAPRVAGELRKAARERGWDRPSGPLERRLRSLYDTLPMPGEGLGALGGLASLFALVDAFKGTSRLLLGSWGWLVVALSCWFVLAAGTALDDSLAQRPHRRPDRRRRRRLDRFLRYLEITAAAAERGDRGAEEIIARYAPYRFAHTATQARPKEQSPLLEAYEEMESGERGEFFEDLIEEYAENEIQQRLQAHHDHIDEAPSDDHDHDHDHDYD